MEVVLPYFDGRLMNGELLGKTYDTLQKFFFIKIKWFYLLAIQSSITK